MIKFLIFVNKGSWETSITRESKIVYYNYHSLADSKTHRKGISLLLDQSQLLDLPTMRKSVAYGFSTYQIKNKCVLLVPKIRDGSHCS